MQKRSMKSQKNRTCLICASIVAALAAIVAVCWAFAPVPIAGAMTGFAGFLFLWLTILAVSWMRYARRFYALARDSAFPTVTLGENLNICFFESSPQDVAAYLKAMETLSPLPARHTREEWLVHSNKRDEIRKNTLRETKTAAYPQLNFEDIAALYGKTIILSRKTYDAYRGQFDYSPAKANNELLFIEEFILS